MTLSNSGPRENNIGNEIPQDGNVQDFLRRYSAADNLGNLDDDLSEEMSDDDINDQIGATTAKILQPLRNQVANMGVDVAVLDETLQALIAQTEGANRRIAQVTDFVVDLIERLEDIDEKARSLLDKWKEESQAISDFTDHADEMTERFSFTMRLQEDKLYQLSELLAKLEGETKRLSTIPSKPGSPKNEADEATKKLLLVEDPENVDFHAKRKAFYALAEKRKTNDTYQTFKADKKCDKGSTSPLNEKRLFETDLEENEDQTTETNELSGYKTDDSVCSETAIQPKTDITKSKTSSYLPLVLCIIIVPLIACLVCLVNPQLCQELQVFVNSL